MEMYLLHEHLAKVKQLDFERELARDAMLRQLKTRVNARPGLRRRLAAALLAIADQLDPMPTTVAGTTSSAIRAS